MQQQGHSRLGVVLAATTPYAILRRNNEGRVCGDTGSAYLGRCELTRALAHFRRHVAGGPSHAGAQGLVLLHSLRRGGAKVNCEAYIATNAG